MRSKTFRYHTTALAVGLLLLTGGGTADAQRLEVAAPLPQLEAVARADSNDAVAHYNLALGYWSEERWDDAARSLELARSLEPRFAPAFLAGALLPFARRPALWHEVLERRVRGEWRDVLERSDSLYQEAFLLNPLQDLRLLAAVVPPKHIFWEVDPVLSELHGEWLRGFDDFRAGDYGGAYLRMERIAKDFTVGRREVHQQQLPAGVLWYRGLAAAHIGRVDEAIRDVRELIDRAILGETEQALTYAPLDAHGYRFMLAALLDRSGRTEEAMSALRDVTERRPSLHMAHALLAALHDRRGELEQSVAARERAVEARPDDPTSVLELGIAYARAGLLEDAERALLYVTRNHPRHARGWYLLGLFEQRRGRTEAARAALQRFLDVVPSRFTTEIGDAHSRLQQLSG